jgi:hypothetical protein
MAWRVNSSPLGWDCFTPSVPPLINVHLHILLQKVQVLQIQQGGLIGRECILDKTIVNYCAEKSLGTLLKGCENGSRLH